MMRPNEPPAVGHNSSRLVFECREDLPAGVDKLTWVKIYIQDLLDDILKMPFDERGFYVTALMIMYKEMEGIVPDDRKAAASFGYGSEVRVYRRLKKKLIERGLLIEKPSGRTSNKRFEDEITKYVTEIQNRRSAALDREEKKRVEKQSPPTYPEHQRESSEEVQRKFGRSSADVRATSGELIGKVNGQISRKPNENNDDATTTVVPAGPRGQHNGHHKYPLRAPVLRLEDKKIEERKEESPKPPTLPVTQPPAWQAGREGDPSGSVISHRWNADGSYSGTAFEGFSAEDVGTMRLTYSALDLNADLPRADRYLAPKFDAEGIQFGTDERLKRLEGLLASWNGDAFRLQKIAMGTAESKPAPRALVPGVFADGFKLDAGLKVVLTGEVLTSWLAKFGGHRESLDDALIESSADLKPNSPIPMQNQVEKVLARICREKRDKDQRYEKSVGRNAQPRQTTAGPDGKTETQAERYRKVILELDQPKPQGGRP